jgi:hypothetical protein
VLGPILIANAARRKELAFVDRRVGVASSSWGRGIFTQKHRLAPNASCSPPIVALGKGFVVLQVAYLCCCLGVASR